MPDLSFYNSLSKKMEPLIPAEPGKVRIYNCGPTVYKRQHLGNMRRFLFADFLRRSLEFAGFEVRDITNITDVGHLTQDEIDAGEDKLEKAARAAKATPQSIAERETKTFFEDIAALNIQPSHKYPRASQHIQSMHTIITALLEKGHAYTTPTGVYFDVTSFPAYGALSGNTLSQIEAGKRVAVRDEKKHPADFALWILSTTSLQKWDSPWGVGYPGWHIECSAMSLEYLGNDIDIHTGGEDNRFPHHENEIAQSEAATGQRFVHVWLHNRHLQLNGQKLAKREGEQLTIDTLRGKGFDPLAFRLLVFAAHYRTKVDFTWEQLQTFQDHLASLQALLRRFGDVTPVAAGQVDTDALKLFAAALSDDLNSPEAWAVFLQYVRQVNSNLDSGSLSLKETQVFYRTLMQMDRVVGVLGSLSQRHGNEEIPADLQQLVQQREEARKNKDFTGSDKLRSQIEAAGYTVEDTSSGPRVVKK